MMMDRVVSRATVILNAVIWPASQDNRIPGGPPAGTGQGWRCDLGTGTDLIQEVAAFAIIRADRLATLPQTRPAAYNYDALDGGHKGVVQGQKFPEKPTARTCWEGGHPLRTTLVAGNGTRVGGRIWKSDRY